MHDHPPPRLLTVDLINSRSSSRESLQSYFLRLAERNRVPALVLREFLATEKDFPQMPPPRWTQGWIRGMVQGTDRSLKIAQMLERIMGAKDLTYATGHQFSRICAPGRVMRGMMAWSPKTLLRQRIQNYPLMWCLESVRICPISREPLRSVCVCGRLIDTRKFIFRIGYCSTCGFELEQAWANPTSSSDPIYGCIRSLEYEHWVTDQVSDFMDFMYREGLSPEFNIGRVLRWWFNLFDFDKSPEIRDRLDVNMGVAENWTAKGCKPTLRKLLHLCHLFRVSLVSFLRCRPTTTHPGTLADPIPGEEGYWNRGTLARRTIDHVKLRKRLEYILERNQHPLENFRQICRERLNIRSSLVYKKHHDLAKRLGARHRETKRMIAVQRREAFIVEMRIAARFLWKNGFTPHHKLLAPYISKPSNLRCAWAMTALKTIRRELVS